MDSLRLDKLFHVLVVLGAASCGEDDSSRRDQQPDAPVSSDGDATTGDATTTSPDGAEGAPCFCDSQACCDRSQSPPVMQAGFTCCWSTACD